METEQATDIRVGFRQLADLHKKSSGFVDLQPSWNPHIESWRREDNYRQWKLTNLELSSQPPRPKSKKGTCPTIQGLENANAAYIAHAIVRVTWFQQAPANGNASLFRSGHGLVVDAPNGLFLVPRAIVPFDLCTIKLNVANIEVPAKVEFLHPIHGYALIRYNPEDIDAPIESARLSEKQVQLQSKVTFVSVNQNNGSMTATKTSITGIISMSIAMGADRPQYRAINLDAVSLETRLALDNRFGVMVDEDGVVVALWLLLEGPCPPKSDKSTWSKHGVPAASIKLIIDWVMDNVSTSNLRCVDVEMRYYNLNFARKLGVGENWLDAAAKESQYHLIYAVLRLACRPPEEASIDVEGLEETDIFLTINGKLVTDLASFSIMYDTNHVSATIVRNSEELQLRIPTVSNERLETKRVVYFCGFYIQQSHIAVRQLMSKLPSEVYVTAKNSGTPADLFKLQPVRFITHVNDFETSNLEIFVKVVNEIPDNTFFRIRTISPKFIPGVITMNKFDYYFPMKIYEVS